MHSTKLFLIGSPVSHSRSPALHQEWIAHFGLDATYEAFDMKPEDLSGFDFKSFHGGNVTAPLKEEVIQYCDILDDTARAIGAVNTIKIVDGLVVGYNTDIYGFDKTLTLPFGFDLSLPIKKALVLGAGGATRAVLSSLKSHGVDVVISSRTRSKADALAEQFGCTVDDKPWYIDADIIVNATGSLPNCYGLFWNSAAIAYDLSYGDTAFLQEAAKAGLATMDGTWMHRHQAIKSFEIWFGFAP